MMIRGARFFLAAALCVAVLCLSESTRLERQIKKFVYNNNGRGTYSFEFESADGTFRREVGGLTGLPGARLAVRGEFGYVEPGGRARRVRYEAGAGGFRARDLSRHDDRRII